MRPQQTIDVGHLLRSSGTLSERLAVPVRRRRNAQPPDDAAQAVCALRLATWRERLTVDGRDFLLPRLRASGISLSQAVAACSPNLEFECHNTEWLGPFLAALAAADGCEAAPSTKLADVPFGELVAPFADAGIRLVARQDLWRYLSPKARASARQHLGVCVSTILQWCLYADFHTFRTALPATERQAVYERYVAEAQAPGRFNAFFNTYAGLARPVGTLLLNWAVHLEELLGRLDADRSLLRTTLGVTSVVVSDIDMTISDPHNYGRVGAILTLATGCRIVYKPAENRLSHLWLSARKLVDDAPQTEFVLTRPGYSWHSYVSPAAQPDDSRDYGGSLGRQLALAAMLGATDLHYENFVWDGSGFHLVDFETVVSPSPRLVRKGGDEAYRSALSRVLSSVLATGALPGWAEGPGGELWNADALGWRQQQSPDFPRLKHVNTDEMVIGSGNSIEADATGLAENIRSSPDSLIEGLKSGWRNLEQRVGELRDLVACLGEEDVRAVLRDTIYYVELTKQGYAPRYSFDVLDRSLLFERLYRPFLDAPTPARWRLCEAEHDAMIRGDVPAFFTRADRLRLREAGASAVSAVALPGSSPRTHALRNVRSSRGASDVQADITRTSFAVADWPSVTTYATQLPSPALVGRGNKRLAAAEAICTHIARAAITGRDGSIALLGPYMHQSGKAQAMGVPPVIDTYMGIAGLGLAAAALNAVSPRSSARDIALRVADSLASAAGEFTSGDKANRCGAFTGPAGVCYALLKLAELLQEPPYMDHAANTYLRVVRRNAGIEPELDVVSGVAGALLVGTALRSASGREDLDAHLRGLVEELVAHAVTSAPGMTHWSTMGVSGGVSGFAHGVAGISAALTASQRLGVSDQAALIGSALNYERAAFVPDRRGWPAVGLTAQPGQVAHDVWCYGAGGILSAAACAAEAGVHEGGELLALARSASLASRPVASGLCHGAAGLGLLELHAGRLLADRAARDSGLERLQRLAEDVLSGRPLFLEPSPVLHHSHGLMTGATGVAFALCAPDLGASAEALLAVS